MRKKSIFLLIIVGLVVWNGWKEYTTRALHHKISFAEVSQIELWGDSKRLLDTIEKRELIKWFNQATDFRKNHHTAGPTPSSGIIIKLNTGERILILHAGEDFEVQRNGVSYWAKHSKIKALLK